MSPKPSYANTTSTRVFPAEKRLVVRAYARIISRPQTLLVRARVGIVFSVFWLAFTG